MFTTDYDALKVVADSLTGTEPINEDTFSSVAVLAERLERLKRTSDVFDNVAFSPQLEELASREMISAIC